MNDLWKLKVEAAKKSFYSKFVEDLKESQPGQITNYRESVHMIRLSLKHFMSRHLKG